MKKAIRRFTISLKWLLLMLVGVEVFSFFAVTVANIITYGGPGEGSRVRYDPYALFLNQDGPRPTPHPFFPLPETRTKVVWLFGGSTMRGATEDDGKTIPGFLAGKLNREGNPVFYRVFNFGENSFNSLLEVNYLQKLLAEEDARPDLIVFYDGANDCVYLSQHRSVYGHHGYRRLRGLVESYRRSLFGLLKPLNAALYSSFTKELYDKITQTLVSLDRDSPLLAEFLRMAENRYDHVQWLADSMGSRFLLVLQPAWWAETKEGSPSVREKEAAMARYAKRFPRVSGNFRVVYDGLEEKLGGKPYFANLRNALSPRTGPAYQADGVHLNDEGRRLVAEELVRVLGERGLF